jgi:hypothetical protein
VSVSGNLFSMSTIWQPCDTATTMFCSNPEMKLVVLPYCCEQVVCVSVWQPGKHNSAALWNSTQTPEP